MTLESGQQGEETETPAGGDMSDVAPAQPAQTPPLALVIFGASGDLTARKILPALASLADRGRAERPVHASIGVARTEWSDEDFRQAVPKAAPGAGDAWNEAGRALPLRRRRVRGDRPPSTS